MPESAITHFLKIIQERERAKTKRAEPVQFNIGLQMGYNQPQKHEERKAGREGNGQRIMGSGNLELNKKDPRLHMEVVEFPDSERLVDGSIQRDEEGKIRARDAAADVKTFSSSFAGDEEGEESKLKRMGDEVMKEQSMRRMIDTVRKYILGPI